MRGIRVMSGVFVLSLALAQACAPAEAGPTTRDRETSGAEAGGTGDEGSERAGSDGTEATEGSGGELVVGDDACTTDADCVPAACCHAAACVAVANAPSCGDAVCTMDCRIGTLDCGGSCLCHEGRCAARLMRAPDFE